MTYITIMSFNIHHGRGTDGVLNLQRIADLIAACDVDVAVLNEVDRNFSSRSDNIDQIDWLAHYLQMDYAFGPAVHRGENREFGNAVLSRYPIADIQNYRLHYRLVEDRALLDVTCLIEAQPIKLYATHLSLDRITHRRQTSFILNKVRETRLPVILAGDWNMKPGSSPWCHVTRHLMDSWQEAGEGSGFTFPSYRPRARLDYIFLSPSFRVVQADVVKTLPEASDHLPLVIKVYTHFQ